MIVSGGQQNMRGRFGLTNLEMELAETNVQVWQKVKPGGFVLLT